MGSRRRAGARRLRRSARHGPGDQGGGRRDRRRHGRHLTLSFAAVGVAIFPISDPSDIRFFDYVDRDHALTIAAELIDGEIDALLGHPWEDEPSEGQFDFERFHPAGSLVDMLLLDAVGEITATTRMFLVDTGIGYTDLLEIDAATWDQLAHRTALPPPEVIDRFEPAWSEALHEARVAGRDLRPEDFARGTTDAHLRFDPPADPRSVARFAGELTTITSDTTGTRISATAAAIVAPRAEQVLQRFETVASAWADGFTMKLDVGLYRLRTDGDGFVVETVDLRADEPTRAAAWGEPLSAELLVTTDDLTVPLAWTEDLLRLGARSGIMPRLPKVSAPVTCEAGWEHAAAVDVVTYSYRSDIDVSLVRKRGQAEEHERGPTEEVPLYRVLQVRPVLATAASLAGPARVVVEDDWIRFVQGPTPDGEAWEFRNRGPVWSILRTVGWAPLAPTPWSSMPPLD